MSYTVKKGAPHWNGKPIKGAGAAFRELGNGLARDDAAVYMRGKPAKVDAGSFEVLSRSYARDKTHVYERLETKLKPIKGADPATFTALGEFHGRDSAAAYALGKKVKIRKGGAPEDFRPLCGSYGTDGRFLYHATAARVGTDKIGFDWSRARLRLLGEDNWVNAPEAVGTDETQVVHFEFNGPRVLEGARFEDLQQLIYRGYASKYLSDGKGVWYLGTKLPGASGAARPVGFRCLCEGEQNWIEAAPAPMGGPIQEGVSAQRHFLLIHAPSGLYEVPRPGDPATLMAARETARPLDERGLAALWGQVLALTELLMARRFRGLAEGEIDAVIKAAPPCDIALNGGTLTCEGLSQPVETWWRLATDVLRKRLKEPLGQVVVLTSNWLPRGDEGEAEVMKRLWPGFLALSTRLYEAGQESDARRLAHLAFAAHRHPRVLTQAEAQALAALPMALLDERGGVPAAHLVDKTTNLGVVRLMITEPWIGAEDVWRQWESLRILHGAVHDMRSPSAASKEVRAALTAYLAAGPSPMLAALARTCLATLSRRMDEPLPEGVVAWFGL